MKLQSNIKYISIITHYTLKLFFTLSIYFEKHLQDLVKREHKDDISLGKVN